MNVNAREGDVCHVAAQTSRLYVVASIQNQADGSPTALVIPLAAADHHSSFAVPCRFQDADRRAVLDEMIEVDTDRLSAPIGLLDSESMATIKRGLRELYGD